MNPFKDKIAIVTGGASGIGQALAEGLGQRGVLVIVADINEKGSKQVAATIIKKGGRAHAVHLDVSKSTQVKDLIHDSAKQYGELHYLFNNAGISVMGGARFTHIISWLYRIHPALMTPWYHKALKDSRLLQSKA